MNTSLNLKPYLGYLLFISLIIFHPDLEGMYLLHALILFCIIFVHKTVADVYLTYGINYGFAQGFQEGTNAHIKFISERLPALTLKKLIKAVEIEVEEYKKTGVFRAIHTDEIKLDEAIDKQ